MTDHEHHDSSADPPVEHEDPLSTPTWVVGIVGGVIFVACVLGVSGLLYDLLGERQDEVVLQATQGRPVDQLHEAQMARLEGPARRELRTDSADGSPSIVIPIDEAMRVIVEEAN